MRPEVVLLEALCAGWRDIAADLRAVLYTFSLARPPRQCFSDGLYRGWADESLLFVEPGYRDDRHGHISSTARHWYEPQRRRLSRSDDAEVFQA